jgi:hypothetical protein
MTIDQVIWEYRQIQAIEYELKTGKPLSQDFIEDDSFDDWMESQGLGKETRQRTQNGG